MKTTWVLVASATVLLSISSCRHHLTVAPTAPVINAVAATLDSGSISIDPQEPAVQRTDRFLYFPDTVRVNGSELYWGELSKVISQADRELAPKTGLVFVRHEMPDNLYLLRDGLEKKLTSYTTNGRPWISGRGVWVPRHGVVVYTVIEGTGTYGTASLWAVATNGGQPRRIALRAHGASFSDDGHMACIIGHPASDGPVWYRGALYPVDRLYGLGVAKVSPDGKRIGCMSWRIPRDFYEYHVGNNMSVFYLQRDIESFDYSSDGRTVLFTREERQKLWTIDLITRRVAQLPYQGDCEISVMQPQYGPGGAIAFNQKTDCSNFYSPTRIARVGLTEPRSTPLTPGAVHEYLSDWR